MENDQWKMENIRLPYPAPHSLPEGDVRDCIASSGVRMAVTTAWLPTAHKMRLLGLALLGIGGAFLYQFVKTPTGWIPGFPNAWRGGPLILGASFFGISGGFLIFQRRFSLAALIVAGVVSAALTSATQGYVRSIREVSTMDTQMTLPAGKLTEFIARSRETVTPDRLRQFAEDEDRKGWLRSGVDFETAYVTFGTVLGNSDDVIVTVNMEVCPFVHPLAGNSRHDVQMYSDFLHRWNAMKLSKYEVHPETSASYLWYGGVFTAVSANNLSLSQLVDALVDTGGMLRFANKSNFYLTYQQSRLVALEWLRDREPDPELKNFLADTAIELARLIELNQQLPHH